MKFTKCKNLHYKKFKLFLLSVLWRASISSRDFFREVNLGPYEETIRQMVLDGDPKGIEFFPILMLTWIYDKSFSSDGLAQPGINRKENGVRYVFPIVGMTYIYYVSPTSLRKELTEFLLLPSDEAALIHIPEGKTFELLQTY